MRLSGNNSNWTIWDVDTSDIPDGYGADILLCHDIVHVAIGFSAWQWWAVGGGIARFDLSDYDGDGITEEWITPITNDNSNMADNGAVPACIANIKDNNQVSAQLKESIAKENDPILKNELIRKYAIYNNLKPENLKC